MKKILAILLLLVSIFALVSCTTAHTTIDTRANRTFFPTARSDLHRQKLQEAYINYERTKAEDLAKNATDEDKEFIYANLNSAIDPSKLEIYNYVSKRDSRRYVFKPLYINLYIIALYNTAGSKVIAIIIS